MAVSLCKKSRECASSQVVWYGMPGRRAAQLPSWYSGCLHCGKKLCRFNILLGIFFVEANQVYAPRPFLCSQPFPQIGSSCPDSFPPSVLSSLYWPHLSVVTGGEWVTALAGIFMRVLVVQNPRIVLSGTAKNCRRREGKVLTTASKYFWLQGLVLLLTVSCPASPRRGRENG